MRYLVVALTLLLLTPLSKAKDTYFHVPVDRLTIDGKLPGAPAEGDYRLLARWQSLRPYAVLDGPGEAFLINPSTEHDIAPGRARSPSAAMMLDVRRPEPGDVSGRLFLPKADASGLVELKFKVLGVKSDLVARDGFYIDKMRYYAALSNEQIAGAAWFRRQARLAAESGGAEAKKELAEKSSNPNPTPDAGLDDTYSLFSGGRALSENLQLDRLLRNSDKTAEPVVAVDSLEGITVAEMNWKEKIAGKNPPLDPLAGLIPADQHAVFFPSFAALIAITEEADRFGTPVVQYAEPRSEDAGTKQRYERQLGIGLSGLGKLLGPHLVASVAITGSDPYLRAGSDVAILLEPKEAGGAENLRAMLLAQITLTRSLHANAKDVSAEAGGITFSGAQSPDRSFSSFIAVMGNFVVVSNSRMQIERLARVSNGRSPALATLPEYTFFRDRYPRGADNEAAFIVLSDATIRRWCSARWRIADSRRTRAAAVLTDLQAGHLDELASGKVATGPLQTDWSVPELGDLSIASAGVSSSTYGSLDFLTPIAELTIDKVTQSEADAYKRWRDTYEQNWRWSFDPIAFRISTHGAGLAGDLTVMPLIAGTDYQSLVQLTNGAALAPGAGDPHDALLHAILAINPKSPTLQMGSVFAQNLAPGLNVDPLSWLGGSVSLYVDDDPFWDEMTQAGNIEKFMETNYQRIPIGLRAEVSNGFKLAAFLTALHGFVDQSAPQMTVWQNLDYRGRAYVKISPSQQAQGNQVPRDMALFYVADGDSLLITLNEPLLRRAIDRKLAAQPATQPAASDAPATQPQVAAVRPWLGQSLCLRGEAKALDLLFRGEHDEFQNAMQSSAWGNIPILNEWKRRFPGQDPLAIQQRFFHARLTDPAGGTYTWNEKWQTMESATYGHPGEPKPGPQQPSLLNGLISADFGLTFEDQGIRAKVVIERKSP